MTHSRTAPTLLKPLGRMSNPYNSRHLAWIAALQDTCHFSASDAHVAAPRYSLLKDTARTQLRRVEGQPRVWHSIRCEGARKPPFLQHIVHRCSLSDRLHLLLSLVEQAGSQYLTGHNLPLYATYADAKRS